MADVSIDSTISTSTARGMRSVVFASATVGYFFYIESGTGAFVYSKTTDGGATWGAAVTVKSAATQVAYDVWFDQWTPGDAGTLIHMWYFDVTNDKVFYRTLDTTGDVLGTERTVFTGVSSVAGRGAFVSGTKTKSGQLYCAYDIDAGAEKGFHKSTDAGVTWSASLLSTFVEATIDQCKLYPATGTGDDNDCWALYQDASADALTLKLWDSSAGTASESATIMALVEDTIDLQGQYGFSGVVRHSDGHLIIVGASAGFGVSHDVRVFDVTSISSFTEKTKISTAISNQYNNALFIDQLTGDLYVAYEGKRDNSESAAAKVYYVKSTDGGVTWSAGDTAYMQGAASANLIQVWTTNSGPRFYVGWRDGSTLAGNAVNSLTFSSGVSIDSAQTLPLTGSITAAVSLSMSSAKGLPLGGSVAVANPLAIDSNKPLPLAGSASLSNSIALTTALPLPLGGVIDMTVVTPGRTVDSSQALPLGGSLALIVANSMASSRPLPFAGSVSLSALAQLASVAALPLGGVVSLTDLVQLVSAKALPLGGSIAGAVSQALSSSQPLPLGGSIDMTVGNALTIVSNKPLPLGGAIVAGVQVTVISSKPLPLGGALSVATIVSLASTRGLPLGGSVALSSPLHVDSTRPMPLSGSASMSGEVELSSVRSLPLHGLIAVIQGDVVTYIGHLTHIASAYQVRALANAAFETRALPAAPFQVRRSK